MDFDVLKIILILIGVAIVVILLTRKGQARLRARLRRGKETAVGICAVALDQTVRKNANKDRAMAFLQEKNQASNEEIREHLGVSRRTVVRYLDALEREGKVEQVGDIGRGVIYRLK